MVLATHQVSLALPRADQVVILTTDGTVAFSGTPAEAAADAAAATLLEDLADPESSAEAPKAVAKAAPIGPQGQANSRLVEEEKRQKGAPLLSNFKLYLSAAGVAFLIGSSLFALQQPTKYVQANSLTNWISAMEAGRKPLSGNGLTLYLVWTAVFCVQTAIAISFQNLGALRASRTIHEKLSWAVLRNPVAWFDASPVGRVQNRFATDIQAVDRSVAMTTMFLDPLAGRAVRVALRHRPASSMVITVLHSRVGGRVQRREELPPARARPQAHRQHDQVAGLRAVQRVAQRPPDASVLRRRLFALRAALLWIG